MKKYLDGVLVDMTTEEIEERNAVIDKHNTLERVLNKLRQKRNRLLTKTDWTANSDVTMSDAMKTYRQQLRDATSGLDTVEKVQAYKFPTEVTE
tara:strand:- start:41 stop:322 length:282 start_codon:yes stop_codon:yes gene_type:complete